MVGLQAQLLAGPHGCGGSLCHDHQLHGKPCGPTLGRTDEQDVAGMRRALWCLRNGCSHSRKQRPRGSPGHRIRVLPSHPVCSLLYYHSKGRFCLKCGFFLKKGASGEDEKGPFMRGLVLMVRHEGKFTVQLESSESRKILDKSVMKED